MPRRKTGDANGGQKSPGPKKSAKVNKITTKDLGVEHLYGAGKKGLENYLTSGAES